MDDNSLVKIVEMLGINVDKLNGKNILWTGTSGFLGKWVVRLIKYLNDNKLKVPCSLLAYDMALPDDQTVRNYANSGIKFLSHDLTTKLWPIGGVDIDYVVHMAGIASPYHYKRRPLETIDVAIEGVRSTLEIARNHGAKFLFTSSSEVYQTATVIPTPESYVGAIASNNERSCYDVSKLMAENLTYVYHKNYGINACSVRIFNSFGAGIDESDSRILPKIASSVVGKFPVNVYSKNILPSRTYCPVENTIAGVFLALIKGQSGEIYNIGMEAPELNVVDLIKRVEAVCGIKVPYEMVNPEEVYIDEPIRRCPDISKARENLEYSPAVTLDEGLRNFFKWSLKNYTGTRY